MSAIERIVPIVDRLYNLQSQEQDTMVRYELEARFGLLTQTPKGEQFVSGVPPLFMEKIMKDLSSFNSWTKTNAFCEMHDFFYTAPGLGKVRTTARYDDSVACNPQLIHCVKTKIDSVTLRFQPQMMPPLANTNSISVNDQQSETKTRWDGRIDLRIDLNREQEIDPSDPRLPDCTNPSYMRIKQRRSFLYTSSRMNRPTWQYDLTFAWDGPSKSDAERAQKLTLPVCEVECELLDIVGLYREAGRTAKDVSTSLIAKMADFVPLKTSEFVWT